jgi:hypothetical protein
VAHCSKERQWYAEKAETSDQIGWQPKSLRLKNPHLSAFSDLIRVQLSLDLSIAEDFRGLRNG